MIPQIAYTNSNCSDVWEMFIAQNRKHSEMPLCVVSDVEPEMLIREGFMRYSNEYPYYRVWRDAANMFGSQFFIYLQEDFVLYNSVDQERIDEYVLFLKDNPKYSFVRLLKVTSFNNKQLTSTLYEIEGKNKNVFSMQPTIWRTSDFIRLMYEVGEERWLETPAYRKKILKMGMMGAYHYDGEQKAGRHHYDSSVYPYIATALVGGKWNLKEYYNELYPLLEEYGIDIDERGDNR